MAFHDEVIAALEASLAEKEAARAAEAEEIEEVEVTPSCFAFGAANALIAALEASLAEKEAARCRTR